MERVLSVGTDARGAEARRSHSGLILIWTLGTSHFPQILAGIDAQLERRPSHERWRDISAAF